MVEQLACMLYKIVCIVGGGGELINGYGGTCGDEFGGEVFVFVERVAEHESVDLKKMVFGGGFVLEEM